MSPSNDLTQTNPRAAAEIPASRQVPTPAEEQILRRIRSLRYGAVEVTIHDSRVVQVETREKIRLSDGLSDSLLAKG